LAAAGLIAGCAGRSNLPEPSPVVTGHVTYRERMALPADAEVRVVLLDVSRQDVAVTPVADTTIRPEGRQVPLPFAVRYDPKRIDPRHDYAIRATITSGGQLAFTTTAVVRVVTRDHPTMVDLILTPVQGAGPASPPPLAGAWRLEDLAGTGVIDDALATLEFTEPGRVSGRGSCNQFSGPVTVTGSAISFGPLVSTMMACAEAVMNQETRYLKALQGADRFALEGPYLLIYAKGIEKPLRFTHGTK
jgi:putative lipoprotein